MQKINSVLLVIIIFFTLSCNKVQDLSEYKGETIVAKEAEIKAIEPKLEEVALYGEKCQFGGVSQEKKEYYIIDYLSEIKDDFYLLKVYDLDTLKLKKTVKLKFGDYMAPNEYKGLVSGVKYLNGKYYIFNQKISMLDENFKYLDCTFFREPSSGKKGTWPIFAYIDYMERDEDGKKQVYFLQGYEYLDSSKRPVVNDYYNKVFLYKMNSGWRGRSGIAFNLYSLKDKVDMRVLGKNLSGKLEIPLTYFVPNGYGFCQGNTAIYGVNTRPCYFKHNPFLNKKVCVKIPWLKSKLPTDEDAYAFGTFKTADKSKDKKFKAKGTKVYYTSSKAPLYFYWMLKGDNNKILFVSELFIDKNLFRIDFADIENGEYIKSLILPYGQHFTRLFMDFKANIPQFYIDLKRGLYIYGDRDEDWNEVVRVCRFKEEN